jgi:hypothetical protein
MCGPLRAPQTTKSAFRWSENRLHNHAADPISDAYVQADDMAIADYAGHEHSPLDGWHSMTTAYNFGQARRKQRRERRDVRR